LAVVRQVPLELVQARAPQLSIRLEPFIEFHERFAAEPVEATLAIGSYRDESHASQHPKVL
jgi:hypothetical protein